MFQQENPSVHHLNSISSESKLVWIFTKDSSNKAWILLSLCLLLWIYFGVNEVKLQSIFSESSFTLDFLRLRAKSDWPIFPRAGVTGLACRKASKVAEMAPCNRKVKCQRNLLYFGLQEHRSVQMSAGIII